MRARGGRCSRSSCSARVLWVHGAACYWRHRIATTNTTKTRMKRTAAHRCHCGRTRPQAVQQVKGTPTPRRRFCLPRCWCRPPLPTPHPLGRRPPPRRPSRHPRRRCRRSRPSLPLPPPSALARPAHRRRPGPTPSLAVAVSPRWHPMVAKHPIRRCTATLCGTHGPCL